MLRKKVMRNAHRYISSGRQEKVELLKRDDDQRQGTVTRYLIFQCRWTKISRTGELIQSEILVDNNRTLHVPVVELKRVGVHHINPADRFIDIEGRYWQPESSTTIEEKLFSSHLDIFCVRIDPPLEA